VEDDRYTRLARREAELAETELERSRSAWLYALSQENEGMRDYFIRIATRARFEWSNHDERARHFEARASRLRPTG
jgi:oligoendopeptidase F